MKIKTSITLSDDLLSAIDASLDGYRSRSEFLEAAARELLARRLRAAAEARDLETINRCAKSLNAEAEDVLAYQVPL